jgi:hypothetical protein
MEQLLLLPRDIHQAFVDAPHKLKQRYLALFWKGFVIKDRKINETTPSQLFQAVLPNQQQKPATCRLSLLS